MKIAFLRDSLFLMVYCISIFFLSHQSTLPMSQVFLHQDKLTHLLAYAVMGVLAWNAFSHHLLKHRRLWFTTVLFCSLYGVSDEFHQSFIEGRYSEVADWLADTLGAVMAASIIYDRCRSEHYVGSERSVQRKTVCR